VLERGVVGHTWRTRRWRSFRIVSPNSLNLLPGYAYDGPDPDGFLDTTGLLAYLEGYAASFRAPVRTGVPVVAIRPADGDRYRVKMDGSQLEAHHLVVATGAFGDRRVPALAANLAPGIHSIHTDDYWAPEDLPAGGVLVVGSGQSGLQIADELARSGRPVVVAVGRHGWVPRRVYGRDQMRWRWDTGDYRSVVADPECCRAHCAIGLALADGGVGWRITSTVRMIRVSGGARAPVSPEGRGGELDSIGGRAVCGD